MDSIVPYWIWEYGGKILQHLSKHLVMLSWIDALQEPNSVVLTEEMARTYFGDEDPLGQTIRINLFDDFEYTVTGVAANTPHNTYLNFDFLCSIVTLKQTRLSSGWGGSMYLTFVLLEETTSPHPVEQQFPAIVEEHIGTKRGTELFLMPIANLYLSDLLTVQGFRGK